MDLSSTSIKLCAREYKGGRVLQNHVMALLEPTSEQLQRMREELKDNPTTTERDIEHLKQWLAKQPHLPKHMEDSRLERFLYGCKLSLERTKQVLDTYYTVRATVPEFFRDRDPLSDEMQDCFRNIYYVPLPALSPLGYRCTILSLADPDVDNFDVRVITKRIVMSLDARLLEEKCLNNIMLIDLQGFTMAHFAKVSPTLSINRKALLCIQDAFPLRLAQVHLLNAPPFIGNILNAFKSFFKEKLLKKVFVHCNGYDTLYPHVPKEVLPKEYGGKLDSVHDLTEAWNQKLLGLQKWFVEEERISKTDLSKRPHENSNNTARALTIVSCDSIHGSFRQLTID